MLCLIKIKNPSYYLKIGQKQKFICIYIYIYALPNIITCTMTGNSVPMCRPCVDVTSCSHEMLSSVVRKPTAVSLKEAYYYCV